MNLALDEAEHAKMRRHTDTSSERASYFEEVKMDAFEFLRERKRMCNCYKDCKGCPLYDSNCVIDSALSDEDGEKIIAAVEQWSKEHPRKTRQSVLLEQWPEANLDAHGCVCVRPCYLSATHRNAYGKCAHMDRDCGDCRREFWMHEVE